MGSASKVISGCLRVVEFGCACIITGILAKFFYFLNMGNGGKDSRLLFALSMAIISIVFSIVLLPPLAFSFYAFPLDIALFICWIVCFALLEDVSISTHPCPSEHERP
jgi:hypothetical protein